MEKQPQLFCIIILYKRLCVCVLRSHTDVLVWPFTKYDYAKQLWAFFSMLSVSQCFVYATCRSSDVAFIAVIGLVVWLFNYIAPVQLLILFYSALFLVTVFLFLIVVTLEAQALKILVWFRVWIGPEPNSDPGQKCLESNWQFRSPFCGEVTGKGK